MTVSGKLATVFEYFDWIERTGLSLWIREDSVWAFPIVLILHTIGLAFLVGANVAVTARIIGGASLCCWVGVMTAGRLLTFHRPPF